MEGWIIKLYSKINCGLVPYTRLNTVESMFYVEQIHFIPVLIVVLLLCSHSYNDVPPNIRLTYPLLSDFKMRNVIIWH